MEGLEKILFKIEEDSNKKTAGILKNAESESERILNLKKEETKKAVDEILKNATKKSEIIVKNAEIFCETQKKNSVLKAKTKVFENWIAKAEQEFQNMSDTEYFFVLEKLIVKYCEERSGEILFSKKDKNRLPKDFLENVNEKISKKALLTLSDENAEIENGFVLRYGLIEQNCSFKALFEDKKDKLKDELMLLLKDE